MTTENETTWAKPCPSVTVSITNTTLIVLGPNPSLPDEDVGPKPG